MGKSMKAVKVAGISLTAIATVVGGVCFFQNRTTATDNEYIAVTEAYSSTSTVVSNLSSFDVSLNQDGTMEVVENTTVSATEAAIEAAIEAATQAATEAATQAMTEAENITEAVTEAVTEAITQAATQAPTQAVTQAPTQAVTQAPTQAVTQAPTQAVTQAVTQAPTQAVTQAPTQAPTQAVTEAATEAVNTPAEVVTVKVPKYTDVSVKIGKTDEVKFDTLEEAIANVHVDTLTDAEARATAAANKTAYATEIADLLAKINAYRADKGLAAVTLNDNLTNASMHRAAESAYAQWNVTAYEGTSKRHIRPNFQKASSIGTEYGITGNFGEIYGRWQTTTDKILAGWQKSTTHNNVLLSSKYTEIGIGIAKDANGSFYWIAIFN